MRDYLPVRLPRIERGILSDLAIAERRHVVAQAEVMLIAALRRAARTRRIPPGPPASEPAEPLTAA
jgi:hypothetical protein